MSLLLSNGWMCMSSGVWWFYWVSCSLCSEQPATTCPVTQCHKTGISATLLSEPQMLNLWRSFMHLHWCHVIHTGCFFCCWTKHSSFITETACMCQDIWWQLQCWGHWQKKHTVHPGVMSFCYCIQSSPLPSVEKNIRCVISKQADDMPDSSYNCADSLSFCIHASFDRSMSNLYVVITSSGHQKLCNLHYSSVQVHN